MNQAIQSRAMLATLSISAWTARKQDKSVSAEVEKAHGAHNAGKYNKLLVDKTLLKPITKLTAKVREFHYCMTLAWADSGARILPSKLFMDYTARIREFKTEFDQLVTEMLKQYPTEIQAACNRLGSMYNPGDYPDITDLRDRFNINIEITPVPDGTDFRVDIGNDAQNEIRAAITRSVAERQAGAVKATYARVHGVVSKIAERLSDDKAVFKDTLISNAIELCQVLDGLNITDDPGITDLCQEIRNYLLIPPSVLRNNSHTRAVTAGHAQRILTKTLIN